MTESFVVMNKLFAKLPVDKFVKIKVKRLQLHLSLYRDFVKTWFLRFRVDSLLNNYLF